MLKFNVVSVGDPTSNGNRIVKLRASTGSDTVLGTIGSQVTYYVAVRADTVKVKEGQDIELDIDAFDVVEREFVTPDTGESIMLKWLRPRA